MAETPATLVEVIETNLSSPQELIAMQQNKQPRSNGTRISLGKSTKSAGWKRARQACTSCRTRKVRCTVSQEWPCSNCRWDGSKCVIAERKRCRRQNPSRVEPAPFQYQENEYTSKGSTARLFPYEQSTSRSVNRNTLYINSKEPTESASLDVEKKKDHLVLESFLHPSMLMESLDATTPNERSPQDSFLPSFIRPLPAHLSPDDLNHLIIKEALWVPTTSLRAGLLQAFVEYVYPGLPIIDLDDFLGAVEEGCSEQRNPDTESLCYPKMSLLLIQAIMFSATAFVNMELLTEAGFSSRKQARRAFYQKVKLLYDSNYELDSIAVIQSLLLITYWHETLDDPKDASYWMGIAIMAADSVGLSRISTNPKTKEQRLLKRIWWSCFVRDRLIGLSFRRPFKIGRNWFRAPPLELSDFSFQAFQEGGTALPAQSRLARDPGMQRDLALIYIAQAQLCVHLADVLDTQYSSQTENCHAFPGIESSSIKLLPIANPDAHQVNKIAEVLKTWIEQSPNISHIQFMESSAIEAGHAPAVLHLAFLHMLYHTVVLTLYRPLCSANSRISPLSATQAQSKLKNSALSISFLAVKLYNLGLHWFLPGTGIRVVSHAMMTFIHEVRTEQEGSKGYESAFRNLSLCRLVLDGLREIYNGGDAVETIAIAAMPPTLDARKVALAKRKYMERSQLEAPHSEWKLGDSLNSCHQLVWAEKTQSTQGDKDYIFGFEIAEPRTPISPESIMSTNLGAEIYVDAFERQTLLLDSDSLCISELEFGTDAVVDLDEFMLIDNDSDHEGA